MFNTRFWPMTANPIKPISQFASGILASLHNPHGEYLIFGDGGKATGQEEGRRSSDWTELELKKAPAFQLADSCSSEYNDPTGLVTARSAIVPIDSPRRYIIYAATPPATIVPQNNILFITAP